MNNTLMRILRRCKWFGFLSTVIIWFFIGMFNLPASEFNHGIGAITNGINASGQYFPDWPGEGHCIRLFVHFNPPNTNVTFSPFPITIELTNGVVVGQEPGSVAKYFMPTNSFCGFIELRNAAGDIIPTLKPEVNSPEAYPASYHLQLMRSLLAPNVGLGPDLPGAINGPHAEVGCFYLKRYFNIEKPGDYQLTIWPKIYKRSETNRDLCERIDLPPVTIPIKWTGSSK